MQKLLTIALATMVAVAPLAAAKARDNHHQQQKYPKGWGPHRGPDGRGYYHGYQGSHDRRPGYRRGNDGLWYPAAAFTIGAILGGGLSH